MHIHIYGPYGWLLESRQRTPHTVGRKLLEAKGNPRSTTFVQREKRNFQTAQNGVFLLVAIFAGHSNAISFIHTCMDHVDYLRVTEKNGMNINNSFSVCVRTSIYAYTHVHLYVCMICIIRIIRIIYMIHMYAL